jgi:hypothetical protein
MNTAKNSPTHIHRFSWIIQNLDIAFTTELSALVKIVVLFNLQTIWVAITELFHTPLKAWHTSYVQVLDYSRKSVNVCWRIFSCVHSRGSIGCFLGGFFVNGSSQLWVKLEVWLQFLFTFCADKFDLFTHWLNKLLDNRKGKIRNNSLINSPQIQIKSHMTSKSVCDLCYIWIDNLV